MFQPTIATRDQWLAARIALLEKEKALTRAKDALAEERRRLPMVPVETTYVFDTVDGPRTLTELFDGRSQLVVYHFMFGPDWEKPCKSCSFWADNFNGIIPHLNQRDVTFVAISRAPLEKLQARAKRMGWTFKWVSSLGNDFNFDYGVSFTPEQLASGEIPYNYGKHKAHGSEMPGISVFFKDEAGRIFHTYSCFARGLDMLNTAYHYLDLVPKGRDEDGLPFTMDWVRLRDEYAA
jgi:predicted dithiol-disulfide oxidoreductase (DUF899 family)